MSREEVYTPGNWPNALHPNDKERTFKAWNDFVEGKKAEEIFQREKQRLSEKVLRLSRKIPLTEKEKLVFYGLVKYPEFSDQQLSEKLKEKRSTITSIKNKLLRKNFYKTKIIPDFSLLECELLCIAYGETPVGIEENKKLVNHKEVVYSLMTDRNFLDIIIAKKLCIIKKDFR